MTTSNELLDRGDAAFQGRDYAAAKELFQQAAELAEGEGNIPLLVEALSMVSRCHLIRDEVNHGRPWIERAKALADPTNPLAWSRYLGVRGRFEWKEGNNAIATATFREMYAFCLKHEQHSRAIDAAHMVAITGERDEQIEWAMKGIQAAEEGAIEGWLGPLWNNLGATYDDMQQYEDALEAYLKARHYHWKVGDEHAKLVADWAVGRTYRRLGQYQQALQWLRPVLAWAERRQAEEPSPDCAEWVGWACLDLGEIAAEQQRTEESLEYLLRAKEMLQVAKMQDWDEKSWSELNERIDQLQT